jgi:DNA mismatch repair protein MSH4
MNRKPIDRHPNNDSIPRDLESKTRDGHYPSSDEEVTTTSRRPARRDRVRNFRKDPNGVAAGTSSALPTPRGWDVIGQRPQTDVSKSSGFTLSSAKKANPYNSSSRRSSRNETSSVANASSKRPSSHVVCSISENLARETCVATLDASRPTTLQIIKQGNGQTYAETLALLKMIQPHEVLLNEGRKNSLLACKVLGLYGLEKENIPLLSQKKSKRSTENDTITPPREDTVIKFLPRTYFDQTKGADLLRKLSRPETYNATLVEEYILLSSSNALIQYAQLCLGAGLSRHSLSLDVNAGGNHRMNMDRATMTNLELLVNAKTGKMGHSLVGSVDCTKTSVGGKLLRTNLMAPPTRLDTIHARLDLVDSFLEDEEFFYVVMEHLEDLPDVDKMLSCVALVPRGKSSNNGALFGNGEGRGVTSRVASRGISALVCIKSTLNVIPSFAHVLEVQLKEISEREGTASGLASRGAAEKGGESTAASENEERPKSRHYDESTTVVDSKKSGGDDSLSDDGLTTDRNDATMTKCSSLDIGLGTSASSSNNQFNRSSMKQTRHQLLRAILIAMRQPALTRVLNAVTDIFTESTAYTKNSHAMRHQECFALKPNTDGMMDILRKAFLANVDDIYRLADEYAETYDISVQVKETTARGYYLSVSADLGLDLPQIFIQPVKNGRFIHCTTEEVSF